MRGRDEGELGRFGDHLPERAELVPEDNLVLPVPVKAEDL